ncbi:MAG: YdcF family protein [Acutalibacteraceae bacterium]|nr:YdcF family protein [Acutalibacteraceae bacterium]
MITVLVCFFAFKEAKASKGTLKAEAEVLLVLGCRVRGESAEPTLQMRIDKAAEYLSENKNTTAILCGGIVHKDQFKSEAQVMADCLCSMGIEKERLLLEDKSLTTVQNFINAKKIMADTGVSETATVGVLSSEFHLMRVKMIADKCEFPCETLAAPSPKKERAKNYIREFFAWPITYKDAVKRRNDDG